MISPAHDDQHDEPRATWGASPRARKATDKNLFANRAEPALVADLRGGEPLGQNVLLFSSDAIADAPSGLHGAAWYFPGARRKKALGVRAFCAESCRRYKIAGLNETDAHHRYMGVYTLQHNEVLGGPTYVKFGVMWGSKHLYFAKGECRIGSHKLADGSFSTTLRARSLATTGIPGAGWEALTKVTKHRREFERKPSLTAWCVQDDCLGASTCTSCTATATCGWCMSNHKCTSAHYCVARAWKQRCGSAPLHALGERAPASAAATHLREHAPREPPEHAVISRGCARAVCVVRATLCAACPHLSLAQHAAHRCLQHIDDPLVAQRRAAQQRALLRGGAAAR